MGRVGELLELAGDEERDLLADVDGVVEDLLDLARLEPKRGRPSALSMSEVVRREVARAKHASAAKGLRLGSDVADGVAVAGNERDLALAVRNLLDNSVRYTERGEVRVRLDAADGRAVLEVTDTGAGIPAKDLPRIFERFYRVDKGRSRESGGTGLGLAIVRHVVDGMGGEVRAQSELGRGSRFVVSLPLG